MADEVRHDGEWMLNFCANARFQMLKLFPHPTEFVVGQRLAFGALLCAVPDHASPQIFFAFFDTLVAGVTHCRDFIAAQQRVCLDHVRHIAGRADHGVHGARRRIDSDMGFQPKVSVVSLLGLVHFRVALHVFVLGRWKNCYQRGIDDRPFPHHQPLRRQMPDDRLEDLACQFLGLE